MPIITFSGLEHVLHHKRNLVICQWVHCLIISIDFRHLLLKHLYITFIYITHKGIRCVCGTFMISPLYISPLYYHYIHVAHLYSIVSIPPLCISPLYHCIGLLEEINTCHYWDVRTQSSEFTNYSYLEKTKSYRLYIKHRPQASRPTILSCGRPLQRKRCLFCQIFFPFTNGWLASTQPFRVSFQNPENIHSQHGRLD